MSGWAVPCRKCGAVGYTSCLTPAGNRRRVTHVDRLRDNSTPLYRKDHPMSDPKTIAEQLDAAQTGADFGSVLQGLFGSLEKARDKEEGR